MRHHAFSANSNDDEEEKEQQSDLNDLVELEQNMNQIFNTALLEMMNKADERKGRKQNEDSLYQSIGLQRGAINLEESVDDADCVDDIVQSPHSMFMSQQSASFLREDRNDVRPFNNSWVSGKSAQKQKSSNLHSRSLFGSTGNMNAGGGSATSPRGASTTFIQPKRSRVQPPQRLVVESGYKSDDSSSDGSVELNAIFDTFFNADEEKHDGDDDSVEDYQLLMSTFNFQDHEDEDEDSDD